MTSEFPHKKEIMKTILSIEPDIKRIFLFGSRARGDNKNPHSDIDIGLVGKKGLAFSTLERIEEALERLDTLYSVEVVDFTGRQDMFTKEALKHQVVIYEKG